MAEFNTVHIVSLENASRFFSGAPVKICHIPVNFFMTIAKIFHNPSKVSYVDLSSKLYRLVLESTPEGAALPIMYVHRL